MAKRFTDTGKWAKASFCELTAELKLVWIYLCDNCDHAGIWDINLSLMKFHLGAEIDRDTLAKAFGDKIKFLSPTKLFIPSFVDFQYGELNPENRAHKSVINRLEKEGAYKALTSPIQGAKDMDKDQDKVNSSFGKGAGKTFLTADDVESSIPLVTGEQWAKRYPDPAWLKEQIQLAFNFHTADPGQTPKTAGIWMRKLHTWFANNWAKRQTAGAKPLSTLDLPDYGEPA